MGTVFTIAIIILFFAILLLLIARFSKGIAEQRIKSISKLDGMSNYIKFASNYDKAEAAIKKNRIAEAKKYFHSALRNLESIEKKDELVIDNIKLVKNRLEKLDKTRK